MLNLTDNAVKKVKNLLEAENKAGFGLRVAVQGGGCSGFQYGLTWEKEEKPNDNVLEFAGLRVFVDPLSAMYLEDVRIDYVDSLSGSGFKIDNPRASGTCGCGSSFSV
ncbi:MAG TPA: iron-sulfur cluster insertion protein ErpA [Candidatus Polarisedimenticolaceae bacterium]|nr:iron-sulfur cluster insertion protein ErpA [Candidatus Polarisedimenticolaceae bacterium]